MKRFAPLTTLSLTLMALGGAHAAQSQIDLSRNGPMAAVPGLYFYDWGSPKPIALKDFQGDTRFLHADLLLGAMNIVDVQEQALAPAMLEELEYTEAIASPVQSVSGVFDDATQVFSLNRVDATGGMKWTTSAVLRNGKKNSATTGGSLQLTNLTIDLGKQSVLADVVGINGVGQFHQLPIWHYGAILDGHTSQALQASPLAWQGLQADFTLGQLTIDPQAFEVLTRALGLTAFGRSVFAAVPDYGMLHVGATASITVVPEPSSMVLAIFGLAGIGCCGLRHRKT